MEEISLEDEQTQQQAQKSELINRDMRLLFAAIRDATLDGDKGVRHLVTKRKCANCIYFWPHCSLRNDVNDGEPESPIWVATRLALADKDKKEVSGEREEIVKILLSVGTRQKDHHDHNDDGDDKKIVTKKKWGDFNPTKCKALEIYRDYELRNLREGTFLGCIPTGSIKGGLTHFAAQKNGVALLKIFKEHGFDMEEHDKSGWSPIMYAASAGAVDAFNYLLTECNVRWEYCNNCTHILCSTSKNAAIRGAMKNKTNDDCCIRLFCCMQCA